jgi:hypothetical protein
MRMLQMPTDQDFEDAYSQLTEIRGDELWLDQSFPGMFAAWQAAGRPPNMTGFISACLRLSSLGTMTFV